MSRWPNKYVIGLTGNIATGKSVVRQMLQHLGCYTVDADQLAHQTMMPGAPAYKPVVNTFGQVIVGADGRIDRGVLGRMVFSDPNLLKKLEEITHPIIRQGINALVSRAQQPVIVIEAIKLLEGGLSESVDEVWVVDAKPQTQYRRLVGKRKMSEQEAKQRILGQNPQAEKLKQAKVVIQNDGDIEQTWKQVQAGFAQVKQKLAPAAPAAPAVPAQPSAPAQAAAPAPTAPAAAAPVPAAQPAAVVEEPQISMDVSGVLVKRGMPGNAQSIAEFITQRSGKQTGRMDVMLAFGQKSYLISQSGEAIIGLMGWTVENLVTRMDEIYLAPGVPVDAVVHALVVAVEDASKELQSEVGFIFLPTSSDARLVEAFKTNGYQSIVVNEIKYPAWREAVMETVAGQPMQVLWKQLREGRVLQPI